MKSLLSKDEKTKLQETFRRQGIIIRKAGIEIEMPSFDASSLKEILRAVNALWNSILKKQKSMYGQGNGSTKRSRRTSCSNRKRNEAWCPYRQCLSFLQQKPQAPEAYILGQNRILARPETAWKKHMSRQFRGSKTDHTRTDRNAPVWNRFLSCPWRNKIFINFLKKMFKRGF